MLNRFSLKSDGKAYEGIFDLLAVRIFLEDHPEMANNVAKVFEVLQTKDGSVPIFAYIDLAYAGYIAMCVIRDVPADQWASKMKFTHIFGDDGTALEKVTKALMNIKMPGMNDAKKKGVAKT